MPVNSPLSHITDVISQVNVSAQSYRTVLQRNEAATRAALVDPILRALGWDTANTHMVEIEKTAGGTGTRVDYALHNAQNKVKAIIEAKSLGGNLGQVHTIIQLFTYAAHYQLGDIWLTDGQYWHHHKAFNAANPAPSKIISLAGDDPVEIATYLVEHFDAAKFWPTEPSVDVLAQEVAKLRQELCTMQNDYVALEQRIAQLEARQSRQRRVISTHQTLPQASTNVPSLITVNSSRTFVDLSSFVPHAGARPETLRLPDRSEIVVRNWKDILVKSCEYVLAANPNLILPLPDFANRTRTLISNNPFRAGLAHATRVYNNHDVYILTNYDSADCIRNANYIFGFLPPGNSVINAGIVCK